MALALLKMSTLSSKRVLVNKRLWEIVFKIFNFKTSHKSRSLFIRGGRLNVWNDLKTPRYVTSPLAHTFIWLVEQCVYLVMTFLVLGRRSVHRSFSSRQLYESYFINSVSLAWVLFMLLVTNRLPGYVGPFRDFH